MSARSPIRRVLRFAAAGAGLAAGAYATWVATGWYRYGHVAPGTPEQRDDLLDRFIPAYDVVERHHIRVKAPAPITLRAAKEQDLLQMPAIRAIFKMREVVLGATPDTRPQPRALLAQMQALGWGVLAEIPGREVVVGAVTRPWEANVTFRALPPRDFAAFDEPGFVKIVWNLRADPVGDYESIFRTETRAVATDSVARAEFRRYWAFVSPGVTSIRSLSLRPLKDEAERRATAHRDEAVQSWSAF
jgi:hypothetical protein